MPSEGQYQESAGVDVGCDKACTIPAEKTMGLYLNGFKLKAPEYKGNAVLRANQ